MNVRLNENKSIRNWKVCTSVLLISINTSIKKEKKFDVKILFLPFCS